MRFAEFNEFITNGDSLILNNNWREIAPIIDKCLDFIEDENNANNEAVIILKTLDIHKNSLGIRIFLDALEKVLQIAEKKSWTEFLSKSEDAIKIAFFIKDIINDGGRNEFISSKLAEYEISKIEFKPR